MAEQALLRDEAARQQDIIARIERLPYHFWHVKMRVIVGVATFFDGLDALMIAYILPAIIPLWKIAPSKIGLLISVGYLGQLIGAFLFGAMAERKGRIHAIIWTISIFSFGSVLCIFSWSYNSLFVFRLIQGLGLGGEVPIAAAYVNELCKAKGRGRFVIFYEFAFGLGVTCAALLAFWVVPHLGWRYMFLIGALPASIVPFFRRGLPESPRWLANKKRFDEAEQVVTRIEGIVSDGGRTELPPVQASKLAPVQPKPTRWTEIFKGIYLKRTLTVWVIWFCGYYVNYGVMAWLPSIYTRVYKLPLQQALSYSLVTSFVGLAGALLSAFFIDILGRKTFFTVCFLGACLSMLMLWLQGASSPQMVMLFASCSAFFITIICGVLYLYNPEIYPTRMRAIGSGIGTAWLRIASAIGPIAVGVIVAQYSISTVFAMFGFVALFGALVTGLFAVETKNRVLEELSP
jgi:MFS transporter, putative metabolite:H+ symporter